MHSRILLLLVNEIELLAKLLRKFNIELVLIKYSKLNPNRGNVFICDFLCLYGFVLLQVFFKKRVFSKIVFFAYIFLWTRIVLKLLCSYSLWREKILHCVSFSSVNVLVNHIYKFIIFLNQIEFLLKSLEK